MSTSDDARQGQALGIRVWMACLATQELLCVYLGVRLGLYDALAAAGPATARGLAERAGIAPRYAREWLEQQAVAGFVKVDDAAKGPDDRVYTLPPSHCEVLTTSDSPLSRIASVLPLGGVAGALPKLLDAYRSGDGLSDDAYGADWREGHAHANRALFKHSLIGWIRAVLPDVHARLAGARVRAADVACGAGWASVALARAYPGLRVDGFDLDEALIAEARQNAAGAGVADRVTFDARDCTRVDPALAGAYDLVCLFDALHEMALPVDVLRACRALRADRGCVLVMDAKVAGAFTAPANEIERFQYTTSVLHCLPACLAERPSAGTGTVMRPDTVRAYAREAGFSLVEILKVEERFHQLYRLIG